ncbi:MAG: transposase [Candidatus Nitrosopolaris sp.]
MSLVKKTYHCKVIRLTSTKQVTLQQEYDNLQHYLQTREDRGLYSANKQQADRYYKIIKKTTKYPLSIRNDLIRLEHDPSSIAEYWVRVPVKAVKGGLWIGLIKPYEPIPKDAKICECKLYERDNRWFIDVVVQKDIPEKTEYQNVIAIDMGIKHIATSVELATNRTMFYGKELNHFRGWYFWLRRRLGLKKAIDTIKKIGHHEKRIANDIIHKITRDIVNRAMETSSLIVLGKLKGLRNQDKKKGKRGRKFNRKLSGFPYFKFTEYLTYKAALAGIKVIKIFENWTSQTCRKCNQRGTRSTQGLFMCKTCGEENADRNAAFNIAYRALGYISKVGVIVNMPVTLASTDRSTMMTRETRKRLQVYDR